MNIFVSILMFRLLVCERYGEKGFEIFFYLKRIWSFVLWLGKREDLAFSDFRGFL